MTQFSTTVSVVRELGFQLALKLPITMPIFNLFLFVAVLGGLSLLIRRVRQLGRPPKGLPPGPSGLPIIGNLHQLSLEAGHKQMKKWAEEYGSMYTIMMGPSQPVIVVSDERQVKALLVKRGSNFSSRPDHYMAHNVLSGGLRVIFMVRLHPYIATVQCRGKTLKICRTLSSSSWYWIHAHPSLVLDRNTHGTSSLHENLHGGSWLRIL